jgi:hypothetical protein
VVRVALHISCAGLAYISCGQGIFHHAGLGCVLDRGGEGTTEEGGVRCLFLFFSETQGRHAWRIVKRSNISRCTRCSVDEVLHLLVEDLDEHEVRLETGTRSLKRDGEGM